MTCRIAGVPVALLVTLLASPFGAAEALAAGAQAPPKVHRIGYLHNLSPTSRIGASRPSARGCATSATRPLSYGPNQVDMYRGAATYVDKILRGSKPADLPVEQPPRFELVVNLKAVKALGLTFPPSILVRADQAIQ